MAVILEIREKMKGIYAEYSYTILLILKLALSYFIFHSINKVIGFNEPLNNVFLVLMISLLCSLFSVKTTVLFAGAFVLGHSYVLGLEVFVITAVLFLLLFVFLIRFDETECAAILLTPIAIHFGIPAVVPICYGLKGKPSSAVSIISGTVFYHYVCMLGEKATLFQNADETDIFNKMLTNMRILVDGMTDNKYMILTAFALAIVVCIVYVICRFSLDYIWNIAIGAGAVVYLVTMISGGLFFDIEVKAFYLILGTGIAIIIALVMEFLIFHVDYLQTEKMEFEDDEYYYYVKAVPKITITKPNWEVKKITHEEAFEEELEDEIDDGVKEPENAFIEDVIADEINDEINDEEFLDDENDDKEFLDEEYIDEEIDNKKISDSEALTSEIQDETGVNEEKAAEEVIVEEAIAEEVIAEEIVEEDIIAEESASEESASEESASEESASEESASEELASEESASNESVSKAAKESSIDGAQTKKPRAKKYHSKKRYSKKKHSKS